MAKYAHITDCVDPSLTVTDLHLAEADVYVDLVLNNLGIIPSLVTLPNATLTVLASIWAKRCAAIEGAISNGGASPLLEKATQLKQSADMLATKITRQSLGIVEPAGFAVINLGRA